MRRVWGAGIIAVVVWACSGAGELPLTAGFTSPDGGTSDSPPGASAGRAWFGPPDTAAAADAAETADAAEAPDAGTTADAGTAPGAAEIEDGGTPDEAAPNECDAPAYLPPLPPGLEPLQDGVAAQDGGASLPLRACVDPSLVTFATAGKKPCAVFEYLADGGLILDERYDDQGRIISRSKARSPGFENSDGGVTERWTYGPFGVERYETIGRDGGFFTSESWRYDQAGREVEHWSFNEWLSSNGWVVLSGVVVTQYGADGRIDRVETHEGGTDGGISRRREYLYDGGQLVRIEGEGGSIEEDVQRFEYHSNGALKLHDQRVTSLAGSPDWFTKQWDEEGRLLASSKTWGNPSKPYVDDRTFTYSNGRLIAETWAKNYEWGKKFHDTDAAGNVIRTRESWRMWGFTAESFATSRMTFACGTSELLLVEEDADNDGHISRWTQVLRDPQRRTVVEAHQDESANLPLDRRAFRVMRYRR